MVETRFPAFTPDGTAVTLKQVLDQVGDQPWLWRLLAFEATSLADSGLDVIDLERRAEYAEKGIELSSINLGELAGKIDQTINIHLVAYAASGKSVFVVQAFDSTEWEVSAEDSDAVAVGAFSRVREGTQIRVWRPGPGDESVVNSATTESGDDFG
jgi:hypothetical protein